MGIFTKKKEMKLESLPPLRFPELPSTMPEFPAYERTTMKEAAAIKEAVVPSELKPLPIRRQEETFPEAKPQQPLFIKVDAYNEVLDTLATIRSKIVDASHMLDELTRLKEEEDKELTAWHSDLSAIKEKLMLVDQKMFE